jgi:putative MFS transporter
MPMEAVTAEPGSSARTPIPVGEFFDRMPLTSRHWALGIALFVSFVIEAWEMMVLVLSGAQISASLHLTMNQMGSLLGSLYFGMVPGCILWGKFTDRIGRKRAIVWSLALYGVCSLASAFSPSFTILWAMRFISGIALSGVAVAPFILMEELLPTRHRGRGAVLLAAGWPVGLLLAITVVHTLRGYGWHVVLAVSSLVGFWAILVERLVPESPYWTCSKGRPAEAYETLQWLAKGRLPALAESQRLFVDDHDSASFAHLFGRDLLRRSLTQFGVNTLFTASTWALATWLPELLQRRGFTQQQGDWFIALTCIPMLPGYISAAWVTSRVGRKVSMGAYLLLASIAGFGLAFSPSLALVYASAAAYYFFNQGAWGIWDTWMGEFYPTAVRGVGYSAGLVVQRLANGAAPIVIAIMLAHQISFSGALVLVSSLLVASLLLTLLLPETEGRALD